MSKWNGNIINKDARYRTQSSTQSRGIYSLDEQLQHVNASNWQSPFNGFPKVPRDIINNVLFIFKLFNDIVNLLAKKRSIFHFEKNLSFSTF